ncbi:MAG: endonuclease dU [Candidatus Ranarchaeia archaeon]
MKLISKKGIRVMGISESFEKGDSVSIIASVIMSGDFVIDGFGFQEITVGGLDATKKIIKLFKELNRPDIKLIIISGCIISWFNIIDLESIYKEITTPIICLTYQNSDGLEKYLNEYFSKEEAQIRIKLYNKIKDRTKIELKTDYSVFIKCFGIDHKNARIILNKFTKQGKYPEPVRVSKNLAHELRLFQNRK